MQSHRHGEGRSGFCGSGCGVSGRERAEEARSGGGEEVSRLGADSARFSLTPCYHQLALLEQLVIVPLSPSFLPLGDSDFKRSEPTDKEGRETEKRKQWGRGQFPPLNSSNRNIVELFISVSEVLWSMAHRGNGTDQTYSPIIITRINIYQSKGAGKKSMPGCMPIYWTKFVEARSDD